MKILILYVYEYTQIKKIIFFKKLKSKQPHLKVLKTNFLIHFYFDEQGSCYKKTNKLIIYLPDFPVFCCFFYIFLRNPEIYKKINSVEIQSISNQTINHANFLQDLSLCHQQSKIVISTPCTALIEQNILKVNSICKAQ